MRARVVAASGLATVLAAAPGALAAPPWAPPRDVTAALPGLVEPSVAFGTDGNGVLGWSEPWDANVKVRSWVASLRPDGTVVDGRSLAGALAAPPQVYARNRTVILRARRRTSDPARVRLDVAFGTTARPLASRFRRVAEFETIGDWSGPALAASPQGEVAVGWTEFRDGPDGSEETGEHRVMVAFGRAGRRFGRPRRVDGFSYLERDSQSIALGYGARGDLVMAYGIGRRTAGSPLAVAARVRRAGRRLGRQQFLGNRRENSTMAAAVAPSGRAVVVWASQDGGEEVHSPWIVRAAIRPPRGRFSRGTAIDPGDAPYRVPHRLAVTMARDGSATAAWGSVRGPEIGGQFPVRTATAPPTGGFGPITQLAEIGILGSLVTAADGTTLITWANTALGYGFPEPEPGDVLAAFRSPGTSAFGLPETVSSPEFEDIAPAAAAFDPRTGRPTVVWRAGSNRTPSSLTGPIGSPRLQLATRSG